ARLFPSGETGTCACPALRVSVGCTRPAVYSPHLACAAACVLPGSYMGENIPRSKGSGAPGTPCTAKTLDEECRDRMESQHPILQILQKEPHVGT
uniref:Uncharacterized protein n=1 Tax=Aegilops tauschii subsp. strangulata TaxID=200361 RepID=A0A452YYR9_AEGTS